MVPSKPISFNPWQIIPNQSPRAANVSLSVSLPPNINQTLLERGRALLASLDRAGCLPQIKPPAIPTELGVLPTVRNSLLVKLSKGLGRALPLLGPKNWGDSLEKGAAQFVGKGLLEEAVRTHLYAASFYSSLQPEVQGEKALAALDKAMDLVRSGEWNRTRAVLLAEIGGVHARLGQSELSKQFFLQSAQQWMLYNQLHPQRPTLRNLRRDAAVQLYVALQTLDLTTLSEMFFSVHNMALRYADRSHADSLDRVSTLFFAGAALSYRFWFLLPTASPANLKETLHEAKSRWEFALRAAALAHMPNSALIPGYSMTLHELRELFVSIQKIGV